MKPSFRLLPAKLRGRIEATEGLLSLTVPLLRSSDSALVIAIAEYRHELTVRLTDLVREAEATLHTDKREATSAAVHAGVAR